VSLFFVGKDKVNMDIVGLSFAETDFVVIVEMLVLSAIELHCFQSQFDVSFVKLLNYSCIYIMVNILCIVKGLSTIK